jgi:DNA-binding transcriptional ArsR family regulator
MLNNIAELGPVFHALSDTNRRRIVVQLSTGPATVSALAEPLPISLPAVMQHLKVLQDSGLVKSEKQGRTRVCTLDAQPLSQAETWIAQRRQFLEQGLDRLEAFLAAKDTSEDRNPK